MEKTKLSSAECGVWSPPVGSGLTGESNRFGLLVLLPLLVLVLVVGTEWLTGS